ncbi:MAG: J domain-containing protein [Flavobacteriales bacterium]|nr:J domain-containing protein [Flavobacteriales bacterium]
MATDYYKTLGVERNATTEQIKAAFRKLARKHHPDLNPNDEKAKQSFQAINEANEVLSDPESRKKYDKYGEQWKHADQFEAAEKQRGSQQAQGGFGGGDPYGGGGYGGASEADFADMFGGMFGGRGGRQVKFRGPDYQAESRLDLRGAYKTHKQTLNVNGKQIRITVPAGVEDGQTIKIGGHGGPGANGGPHGDLYITFRIEPDPKFQRVGKDLYITETVDLTTALLGGTLTLDTLDGAVKLNVAPETQNNTKVKLKGKGFPVYKKEGEFGDLYVTYTVELPKNLTEREKELIKELAELRNNP